MEGFNKDEVRDQVIAYLKKEGRDTKEEVDNYVFLLECLHRDKLFREKLADANRLH